MASEAELIALLVEADEATNEIAEDIAELLAREPNISAETLAAATALTEKLKGVAAVVPEPEAPPAEPPA